MVPTKAYVEQKFDEFNHLMFGGKLPRIPVEMSDAKTFLGKCVYRKRRKPGGKTEFYDFRLRINTRADLPQQEVDDTIIHEMIHYHIGYNQLKDTSSHGVIFMEMMNTINQRFGRHITVSYKSSAEERAQLQDKRPRYHVIAFVRFVDGHTGIKVLPRVAPTILKYYNMVSASRDIANVSLYMSNNTFFNQYPNSGALKVHPLAEDEIIRQLEGAEKLGCDGKAIIRNADQT